VAAACTPLVRRRAIYLEEYHLNRKMAYENSQKELMEGEEGIVGVEGEKELVKENNEDVTSKMDVAEEDHTASFLGVRASDITVHNMVRKTKAFFTYNGLDLGKEDTFDSKGNKIVQKDWISDFSPEIQALQDRAEVFESRTERVFGVLQVFSAICVMFAHGAGEVGYMAGPLATIYVVNQTGKLPKSVEAPLWVLFISAFSLVAGLATYGKTMTKAVGTEFCKLTPARGFAAELSTAVIIMVASQYGLPTSSSQCITGGIVGIGLCEGASGVNWTYFGKTFASWIVTMFVMGVGVGLLFTQGHTAP
jgi:phosphate/sulfate permease